MKGTFFLTYLLQSAFDKKWN